MLYFIYKYLNDCLVLIPLVEKVDQWYNSESEYFRKACDSGLFLISLMGSWFEGPTLTTPKIDLSF